MASRTSRFRFLDAAGQWQTDWPPLQSNGPQALVLRPRAVEVAMELKDFGRITRLVEVSG